MISQQTEVDLRLIWDSVQGLYCSNIEQVGLTWALLSDHVMCISSMGQWMSGSFNFWPISFSHLCCGTHMRKRLHREAQSLGQLQMTCSQVKSTYVMNKSPTSGKTRYEKTLRNGWSLVEILDCIYKVHPKSKWKMWIKREWLQLGG